MRERERWGRRRRVRRKIYLLFPQERKMEGRRDESAKGKRGVRKGVCVCVWSVLGCRRPAVGWLASVGGPLLSG